LVGNRRRENIGEVLETLGCCWRDEDEDEAVTAAWPRAGWRHAEVATAAAKVEVAAMSDKTQSASGVCRASWSGGEFLNEENERRSACQVEWN
jgi:hypothetical protein